MVFRHSINPAVPSHPASLPFARLGEGAIAGAGGRGGADLGVAEWEAMVSPGSTFLGPPGEAPALPGPFFLPAPRP